MILLLETIGLCLLFFLMCFLGTGNDKKNINNFKVFSKELQEKVLLDEEYKTKIKKSNPIIDFVSNLILFLIILFILGIFIRKDNYLHNFLSLLIIGETLNLFDLLVIDILWFRNSKRVRLSKYPLAHYYKDIRPHAYAFLRAIPLYIIVALIDGAFLLLF